MLEFHVLGPLDVRAGGASIELGGPRQRAVLAALLLRANEMATVEYLADAVWETPPARPASNIRTYVSGLRSRLTTPDAAPDRLVTRPGGYQLAARCGELDLVTFHELDAAGDRAIRDEDSRTAAVCFRQALALWHGQPLEGLVVGRLLTAELARLAEQRLSVVEKCTWARLDLGQHAELIGELRGMLAQYPLREQLWGQLMVALQRSGRRGDALAAYQEVYRLLDTELGVEPGRALQQLHTQVLADDPRLGQPTVSMPVQLTAQPAAPTPRQLPPDVAHYTGRQGQLDEVTTLLTKQRDIRCPGGGTALPVVAVTGQAGAGKTAFVVKAGHLLEPSFPDGQLFVDLLGASACPCAPEEVLARFLRDLGVPGVDIPHSIADRASMYRDRLAAKRVLLVLDNAAAEEQVRPLLPGGAGCAVLVTSRRRLTGLDVSSRVPLGALEVHEAVRLLADLSGQHEAEMESAAANRIVELCGWLPLALRIIGTKLRVLPHLTAESVADRLADERHRLDELVGGDREIRAGFLVSYDQLPPVDRRAFRMLALLPGNDFAVWAAAAVLGEDVRHTERVLESLAEANLVMCGAPGGRVRYRFHDLIRLFAEEKLAAEVAADERDTAMGRLLDTYLYLARRADRELEFGGLYDFPAALPHQDIAAVAERAAADPAGWFDEEHKCLLAATRMAPPQIACRLGATLGAYLELRAEWHELIQLSEFGLAAARSIGSEYWTAYGLFALGLAARERRDVRSAQEHFRECLALLPEVDDPLLEVVTLLAVGVGHRFLGRLDLAEACFRGCLTKLTTVDDPRWTAYTLRELGILHRYRGERDEAERYLRQGADMFMLLGHPRWEAACLRELGVVRRDQGDHRSAIRLLTRAKAMFRALGDVRREAAAWRSLALTYWSMDDLDETAACCGRSSELFARTLDAHGIACTEVLRAQIEAASGHNSAGIARVRDALAVFLEIGDVRWTGKARLVLGTLLDAVGEHAAATVEWRMAHEGLVAIRAFEAREAEACLSRG